MASTRHLVCPENEPLALFILEKRDALLQNEVYKENLDLTMTKAYRGVCDSSGPIRSLGDARNVKGVGVWMLKMLREFFKEESNADGTTVNESGPKAKKSKASKAYVPQRNSAPYAILLTLYRAMEQGSKFLLKQELIDAAEASGLSRAPIQSSKSAGPSSLFGTTTKDWYSGWSSMKTLISRGLVVKSSCPAKFKLTDEGKITAEECLFRSGMTKDAGKIGLNGNMETCTSIAVTTGKSCNASLVSDAVVSSWSATLLEHNSEDSCGSGRSLDIRYVNGSWSSKMDRSSEVAIFSKCSSEDNGWDTSDSGKLLAITDVDGSYASKIDDGADVIPLDIEQACFTKHGCKMQGPTACNSFNISDREKHSTSLSLPPLRVGERFSDAYTVVIILDDREQFMHDGKGLNSRLKFADRLRLQYNIEVEIRHLPVGDTIWIARHKITRQEYVLDFVVERKKVGDLLCSIRDTRYKQQKLRLMRCGLKKLIYLVEGDPNVMDSAESIKTACFTTEIVEGFDVQRTRDIAETLRKYGELTNAIFQYYDTETGTSQRTERSLCKTYNAFLEHCTDLEKEKVTDVFGAMLMQVKHVTEDIALSVLDKYPTPLSLVLAYLELVADVTAQEQLLKGIPIRNQNRNISSITSRNIFKFIWSPEDD